MPGGANFELTPTDLIPFNDGTGRLMLATLGGTIRVIDGDGNLLPAPLLATSQTGLQLQQESGMTGIALHPDFARPGTFGFGKLYTITTENGSGNGGLGDNNVDFPVAADVHQDIVREWDLTPIVGNRNANSLPAVQLGNSRELLRVDQPGPFHNVVDLAFNSNAQPGQPDYGQLYITSGDGGAGGNRAQDRTGVFGKVLRINPSPAAHPLVRTSARSGQPAYSVSPDNPFNGDDATESTNRPGTGENDTLAEVFAYGLRSPYRLTFDRGTGDLYLGDVGDAAREEVDRITAGENYGWPSREGTLGAQPPGGSVDPLFEYPRSEGQVVVGGFVYRGTALPQLVGKYVFADFGQGRASGRLFYGNVDPNDPNVGDFFEFVIDAAGPQFPIDVNGDLLPDSQGLLPDRIFSIGEDERGELYLVAGQDPRGFAPSVPGAFIVRVVPEPGGLSLAGAGGVALVFVLRRRLFGRKAVAANRLPPIDAIAPQV
jgi:hypothetical protein